MAGPNEIPENEQTIGGRAVNFVENAGSKVEDVVEGVIGEDHLVVRKTKKAWQYFLLYPAVFGALIGAIPTGIDLYKSFKYGISVSDVAHAEKQKDLWIKNIRCVQSLSYHTVKTEDKSMVQIGACQNGDVLIELIPEDGGTQVAEWVSLDRAKAAAVSSVGSLLFSKAFASSISLAAAAGGGTVKTVCTSIHPQKQLIERIVKRGNVCTREINNMITRKSVKTEVVPCDTKCTPMK
ncbi:MAG: hypothetical protein GY927_17030 [bacterium]|nr:hypothetical protein [bacterium]